MHIAYVTNGLPYSGNNGVPMLGWSLTKYFLEQGHKVTVLGLCPEGDTFCSEEHRNCITRLGANLHILAYKRAHLSRRQYWEKVRDFLSPASLCRYYPTLAIRDDVERTVRLLAPDAIVAVHTEALAPLMGVTDIPLMGLMGDPTHLPSWFSIVDDFEWRKLPAAFRQTANYLKALPTLISMDVKMLAHCRRRGAVAAHYANWFKRKGVDDCQYFRIPIADELGKDWRIRRESVERGEKFKIVLLGALHGTATTSGLRLFAHEIYPEVCSSIGEDNFEVHVIGSGSWPDGIRDITHRANVFKRGYVEDLQSEMLSSDVLVVPTPINLGIRVRVLTALSYGQCIVAHKANACGIPELVDAKNSLLGGSGIELASLIVDAYKDPLLRRRLEEGARRTYEEFFSERIAAGRVLDGIEEMVNQSLNRFSKS